MKARKLILSLGIASLALSGAALADNQDLRTAMRADTSSYLAAKGRALVAQAPRELDQAIGTSLATNEPYFPAAQDVIRVAEAETEIALEAGENAQKGFGGLVVYSGSR